MTSFSTCSTERIIVRDDNEVHEMLWGGGFHYSYTYQSFQVSALLAWLLVHIQNPGGKELTNLSKM